MNKLKTDQQYFTTGIGRRDFLGGFFRASAAVAMTGSSLELIAQTLGIEAEHPTNHNLLLGGPDVQLDGSGIRPGVTVIGPKDEKSQQIINALGNIPYCIQRNVNPYIHTIITGGKFTDFPPFKNLENEGRAAGLYSEDLRTSLVKKLRGPNTALHEYGHAVDIALLAEQDIRSNGGVPKGRHLSDSNEFMDAYYGEKRIDWKKLGINEIKRDSEDRSQTFADRFADFYLSPNKSRIELKVKHPKMHDFFVSVEQIVNYGTGGYGFCFH